MASSSNSVPRTSWIRYANMSCLCSKVARIKVSMSHANPNRLFYKCDEGKCNLFCWCEPIPDENGGDHTRQSNVSYFDARISRLEEEVSNLKREIDDVVESMKGLQDEACAMKVECVNGLSVLKKELDDALSHFKKRIDDDLAAAKFGIDDDLAAAKLNSACLSSEISTLKKQLKEMEQSNRWMKCFIFGFVFVVLSILMCNMK
ncbi:hypothetical protein P8452_11936 [Trifolium repens]|nr:hypothetical protein P8452_11936 [Trifolium repens]